MPFKPLNIRPPKYKPRWHRFNCLRCGHGVDEYSDPRGSLLLCPFCWRLQQGTQGYRLAPPTQVMRLADWWALFCMEYQDRLAAGLIDVWGNPQKRKG